MPRFGGVFYEIGDFLSRYKRNVEKESDIVCTMDDDLKLQKIFVRRQDTAPAVKKSKNWLFRRMPKRVPKVVPDIIGIVAYQFVAQKGQSARLIFRLHAEAGEAK